MHQTRLTRLLLGIGRGGRAESRPGVTPEGSGRNCRLQPVPSLDFGEAEKMRVSGSASDRSGLPPASIEDQSNR
jgi:hypothetical protein